MKYQSVTEDWELSIRLQRDGYYIFATHQLETWGRPPETLKAYLRQQERWAEGTIRDIKHHFWNIMKNRNLGLTEKFGFIFQGGHYIGGPLFILYNTLVPATLLLLYPSGLLNVSTYLLMIYWFVGSVIPEKMYDSSIATTLIKVIMTSPIYSKAIVRGLFDSQSSWITTKRKSALFS